MGRHFSVFLAACVAVFILTLLTISVQAQSATPPQPPEIAIQGTTGETKTWRTFSTKGFLVQYPADWHLRLLPAQLIHTQVVEFYHSTPDNLVDASIRVYETQLAPDEDWQQDPELIFWRGQGAQVDHPSEAVLVNGDAGWLVKSQRSAFLSGDLTRAAFVARNGRLYRFRLWLFQDQPREPYLRIFGLMLGTLQSTPNVGVSPKIVPTLARATSSRSSAASDPKVGSAGTYNRGAAYAYAATWWNQRNNSDGCYLWYNGSVLDCAQNAGDYGMDGAHFVNRAVWTGGRPIPQLLPGYPAEARSVSTLRTWLINDGWTVVSASQAQIGDVVIIGNQCWTGLVVVPGNPPTVATHSAELWTSVASLQCGGSSSKEYLHASQGGFYTYLPLVLKNSWTPPPQPVPKYWSGMHMGNRNNETWTDDMLRPFDPAQGGAWPTIAVALSHQLFTVNRDANCHITSVSVKSTGQSLYNYLKQATLQKGAWVIIRIYPSPGNFEESIDPNWPNPQTRPPTRTLISQVGVHPDPAHWTQCRGYDEDRFRSVDDIGDEILAIQRYVHDRGWDVFGFEPANEPNVEWFANPENPEPPKPAHYEKGSWQAMDPYFANLYDYVHANAGSLTIRVFTPPMAQGANAETGNTRAVQDGCNPFGDGTWSGYGEMPLTFNSGSPKNDGYSWHNYFIQGKEAWAHCPDGQHVSLYFPEPMSSNIQYHHRSAIISEADLAPPQIQWNNPVTDKDTQSDVAAQSIRQFLYCDYPVERVAVWLLNDNTGNAKHEWAQAYSSVNGIRAWFINWWYGSENFSDCDPSLKEPAP